MAGKIKKLAEKIANPGDLVKANIYSSPIKNIGKVMQIEIAKKIAGKPKKMELGGEATSNPPSKKSLTDKARDIIEKNSSYNSSFNKVADMLTKKGFTGAAGEKGKVSATERRKKLNRDIFKGGQSKQVPQGMRVGGEAKPLVGGQKKLDKNKDGRISGDDFAMMEMGGKVEEYGGGGKVKGGKMSCRGMGAALRGGGYKIS